MNFFVYEKAFHGRQYLCKLRVLFSNSSLFLRFSFSFPMFSFATTAKKRCSKTGWASAIFGISWRCGWQRHGKALSIKSLQARMQCLLWVCVILYEAVLQREWATHHQKPSCKQEKRWDPNSHWPSPFFLPSPATFLCPTTFVEYGKCRRGCFTDHFFLYRLL